MKCACIIFLSFCFIYNANCFEISNFWSKDYKKRTRVECEAQESFCLNLCGDQFICEIEEGACKDCAGTSLFITNIYKNVGKTITNSAVSALSYDVLEILLNGNYITLSARSPFNHLTRLNSKAVKRMFASLCQDATEYPHLILEVESKSRRPKVVKYVSCKSGVYEIDNFRGMDTEVTNKHNSLF